MKPARNDPCPCGSGKKYKRCCIRIGAPPHASTAQNQKWVVIEDELTELSNGVLTLIDERRFEEALVGCKRLLDEYPEVVDGLERSAMLREAQGDFPLALDFYRKALAFTKRPDQRDGFDEDGRDYLRKKIAEVEARTEATAG